MRAHPHPAPRRQAAAEAAARSPEHLCEEPPLRSGRESSVQRPDLEVSSLRGLWERGGGSPVIRKARACSEFSGVSSEVPAAPAKGKGGAARSRAEPGRRRSKLKP